ncbi:MAG TPA: TolC family protein [Gemmatimonadaceae bacterium]|nr:TolC family protein [Gemmatimonadaceae bacterium]
MRLSFTLCAIIALSEVAPAQQRAGAPTQIADSLRLTRRQAIAEALTHNAQLEVARQQTAQSRARRIEGISIPDPALTAAYDESPQPFSFGGAGARDVAIDWLLPFPSKVWLRNKIGNADIGSFESNYRLQTQLIASQTSQQYDSLLVARKHRDVLLEGRSLSSDFLKRTQARYTAGTAAKLDVIKAQVDLAQSENQLIANELDIANAQAALNRLIGRVIAAPIAPADSLEVPPPLPDSLTIEQTALQNRPELTQLESQQRGAQATTSLLRQFWIPDFTFGISHDYTQPGAPVFSTGIALPLPVLFWQHSKGEIAESRHHEQELAASYRDLRAQVTQDVRSAYATASTSLRQVLFLRDQLVPSAREAFRVASVSYSLGGSSALEVLDARRTLLDAESQLADALASANIARADLERALGVPLSTLGVR